LLVEVDLVIGCVCSLTPGVCPQDTWDTLTTDVCPYRTSSHPLVDEPWAGQRWQLQHVLDDVLVNVVAVASHVLVPGDSLISQNDDLGELLDEMNGNQR
jgi:hypothetical protein